MRITANIPLIMA